MGWTVLPADAFHRYRERWQQLNTVGDDTPVLDAAFVAALLEHFSDGHEVLALHGGELPDALGLLAPTRRGSWQTFQPPNAVLGSLVWQRSLPLQQLLAGLPSALPRLTLKVSLCLLDPDQTPRPANQGRLRTVDFRRTARVRPANGFDSYMGALKKLRRNIRSRRKRVHREGRATRLEILTDAEDMPRAVADHGCLEVSGWKGEAGSALTQDNRQGKFYRAVMLGFAQRDEAIAFRYWYDDKLVASDLCLHRHGVPINLKTAYAEAERKTAPAQMLREEAYELLFDRLDFDTVEFFGPLMDWHQAWTDDLRTLYQIDCYRWPLLASLASGMERGHDPARNSPVSL